MLILSPLREKRNFLARYLKIENLQDLIINSGFITEILIKQAGKRTDLIHKRSFNVILQVLNRLQEKFKFLSRYITSILKCLAVHFSKTDFSRKT